MAPAICRSSRTRRKPLAPASPQPQNSGQLVDELREIFNNSQHPGSTSAALDDLKKLYKNTNVAEFQGPFTNCLKKLFQSEPSNYYRTSCTFVCNFLKFVSEESDQAKTRNENSSPAKSTRANKKTQKQPRKSSKQTKHSKRLKRDDSGSEDEIVAGLFKKSSLEDEESMDSEDGSSSQPGCSITEHDKLISSCLDIAGIYRIVSNENFRRNAVQFINQFLSSVESIDEGICDALRVKLQYCLRDKKAITRGLAVLALRSFQDQDKTTAEAFRYHFERDPELAVRKALLKVMSPDVFGYNFIVDSTRDPSEIMRKAAYIRLNKMEPIKLNSEQFHSILHNGLNERDPQVAYKFKTETLKPWLSQLYDGLDLHKMLAPFDVLNHKDDVVSLLDHIYDQDLQEPQTNGTSTKLHHVVENFRERWLNHDTACLPNVGDVDEKFVIIWFSLVKFCKDNEPMIESVKIRTVRQQERDANESIEQLLESQENIDESIALYERLCPDLVNLVEFLKEYIKFVETQLNDKKIEPEKAEFIYLQIMEFITTHEVGDELERKTVQEVFDSILRESLLVSHFNNFIPPIIKCLYKLVYSRSSNLMVNYISELIQNIRSHLEDIEIPEMVSTEPQPIFKNHPDELIKCLQMYLGCLQSAKVTEVQETMLIHLRHLSFEALNTENSRIRCLMVACNGVTALVDENFVKTDEAYMELLVASCYDKSSPGIQTTGFKCLVDVVCQHDELEIPEQIEQFLFESLGSYGRYDAKKYKLERPEFITVVIEGTTKLFYLQKIKSADLLAHLIIWWYHPHTPSKLKQFIGIFLPVFVNDLMKEGHIAEAAWFKELLMDTFVISIETLHAYLLTDSGSSIMASPDIHSLINFLSNLIPVSLHSGIAEKIDSRLDELEIPDVRRDLKLTKQQHLDLCKYLKHSKEQLSN